MPADPLAVLQRRFPAPGRRGRPSPNGVNMTHAAKALGMSVRTLQRRLLPPEHPKHQPWRTLELRALGIR